LVGVVDESPYSLADPGDSSPALRRDLRFRRQDDQTPASYVVEDPTNGRFFRIGVDEYALLMLLDGRHTLAQVVERGASQLGARAFTEHEVLLTCQWLWREGLLDNNPAQRAPVKTPLARFNPLFWRTRLGDPSGVFARLYHYLHWLLSPAALAAWVLLVATGLYTVVIDITRFQQAAHGILTRDNALWLVLIWIGLKIVHETSHGLVCRHFGGAAREAGVYWILFMPLVYVDVSNMWRFRSRWARIATAGAGMYAELAVAAVAALVWSHSAPGLVNHLAYNIVAIGAIASLLVNANPLMRFDGYHMLADFLAIPNLYGRGQQFVRWLGRRLMLGAAAGQAPRWPGGREAAVAAYGVASSVWRVMVTVLLMIAASQLLAGAGVVLVVLSLVLTSMPTISKWLRGLAQGQALGFSAAGFVRPLVTLVALLTLFALPWPGRFDAPALIDFDAVTPLRTTAGGFVRAVHVADGEQVRRGQLLAVLENPELSAAHRELELELAASIVRVSAAQARGDLAAASVLAGAQNALSSRVDDLARRLRTLNITAPTDATVVSPQLAHLVGQYLKTGAEVLTLANTSAREIRASVPEIDAQRFAAARGATVDLELDGGERVSATLEEIEPQASTTVVDLALSASGGGPIAVRMAMDNEGEGPRYVAPRFLAKARVTRAALPVAGQRGRLHLPRSYVPAAQVIYERIAGWFDASLRAATRART
jgi:putative peptide zinc metalloprotease protein